MVGMLFVSKTVFKTLIRTSRSLIKIIVKIQQHEQNMIHSSFHGVMMLRLIMFFICVLVFFGSGKVLGQQAEKTAIVVTSMLNVRSGPDKTSLGLFTLYKGDIVEIIDYEQGWLKVQYKDKIGYVRNRKKYVTILEHPITDRNTEKNVDLNNIEHVKTKVRDIDLEIKQYEIQVNSFSKKELEIMEKLNRIEDALDQTGKQISVLKNQLTKVDIKIAETDAESKKLLEIIQKNEKYALKRVAALYKLSIIGKMNMLASANSFFEIINRKTAMENITNHDFNLLETLKRDKTKLLTILSTLDKQKHEKLSLGKVLKEQLEIISREKRKRSELLADVRNKKALGIAKIEYLRQAAEALNQVIISLRVKLDQPKNQPEKQFISLKGLLEMPVHGKIISFFGSYKNKKFNVTNFRSGIEIQANIGTPIRTVANGQVLYADWFKGYGNMIIINHGDNYYTVYAHAQNILKKQGDNVATSEVIATVGNTASMTGPGLYFEVRHHGKPVNPIKWLNTKKKGES